MELRKEIDHIIEKSEDKVIHIFNLPSIFLIIPILICGIWCFFILESISSQILSAQTNTTFISFKDFFLNNTDIQIFLLSLSIGITVVYILIANLINYNSVDFKLDHLVLSQGPLPWPGKKSYVRTITIQQCRVERYWAKFDPEVTNFYYRVWITLKDETELLVDKEIEQYEDAKNLEHWITNYLRLESK